MSYRVNTQQQHCASCTTYTICTHMGGSDILAYARRSKTLLAGLFNSTIYILRVCVYTYCGLQNGRPLLPTTTSRVRTRLRYLELSANIGGSLHMYKYMWQELLHIDTYMRMHTQIERARSRVLLYVYMHGPYGAPRIIFLEGVWVFVCTHESKIARARARAFDATAAKQRRAQNCRRRRYRPNRRR